MNSSFWGRKIVKFKKENTFDLFLSCIYIFIIYTYIIIIGYRYML
jgi:hypothetical protein